eukprot:11189506-Prorocentrum_lima.AAC.1
MKDEPQGWRPRNDSMLPVAGCSALAARAEMYSRFGSWTICQACHMLRPKPFEAMDVLRNPTPEITAKACVHCVAAAKGTQ